MPDRIEDLQKRLTKDPGSKIFAQLAEEYRKAGMLREAIATCRDGLAKHPTYFSARVALGRALLEAGSFEEARAELEKVLAQVPDNILAHKFLAEAYYQLGRLDEAFAKYQVVQSLAPGDAEILERIQEVEEALKRTQAPPPVKTGPPQDRLYGELDETLIAPPSEGDKPAAPSAAEGSPTSYLPEGEMIFDAQEAEASPEALLEEPKPVTSIFERQAREVRQSSEISEEARALQEEFESGPVTSTFNRQAREIRGGETPKQPAPADSEKPAGQEEEFAVGELTSYFLGRPAAPPAEPGEQPPDETPSLNRIPTTDYDEPEPVPGTESYAYLGQSEGARALAGEEQAGEGLTSEALADLYVSQGHLEQALALLRNLLSAQPANQELRNKVEEVELLVRASQPVGSARPAPSAPAGAPAKLSADAGEVQEVIRALEGWLEAIRRR
jgi:tetratricopeptide (TPR) repeat protein